MQYWPDLRSVVMDYKHAKEAAKILRAEYYGPDNAFDVNKDIENGSITYQDVDS